jgi:hypothetical protein
MDELQPRKPTLGCEVIVFVDDGVTVIPVAVLNREFGGEGDSKRNLDDLAGFSAVKK